MEINGLEEAARCLAFIEQSVSCFHAVENVKMQLQKNDFIQLKEEEEWDLEPGKNYFVTRNDSSILAFKLPEKEAKGFHITASHSDSPTFKVKSNAEESVENHYVKLHVEPYGGMIYATWLDRCLSVAGRIIYRDGEELKSKIVNVDEDLLVIPNLAIHMNREMNKGLSYNPQTDLQPLMCACGGENHKDTDRLMEKIAMNVQMRKEDILGKDLFLYVREKGKLAGADKELMISPRLDDLECVYASLEGFLRVQPKTCISVCAVFDNEEVGSHTRQGAASTFLKDTLERIGEGIGKTGSSYLRLLAGSFMISADNAHALHPSHPEKADPANSPVINGGIVIKHHGAQKYTTDGYSEAVMKSLCQEAGVPCQDYHNRSDVAGGSTLGNISAGQVSVPAVDVGLAQLAMHSAVETAGSLDVGYLIRVLEKFHEQ